MKSSALILRGLIIAAVWVTASPLLRAQAPATEDFPGLKKALTPEQYAAAGLGKLSPDEQTKLDASLRAYFSGASQRVAQQAVDRAVKEKKAEPSTFIEGHLTGTFTGWNERTVFVLDNGQRWKPVDAGRASFPPVESPQIFIARDAFGYKMAILGGSTLRVRRL